MRAGKLRHKLLIEQYSATRNASGEEVKSWATYKTAWGTINPISGREFFEAQQVNAEVTHRIRIRYQSGITPKMRINHINSSRIFNIVAVRVIEEKNREIEILAKEDI